MRLVPSTVTVVTAASESEMRGITIGSFTSVSLDPPLVSFNVSRDAQMFPVITGASRFAVHLLGEEQAPLSNHFAIPDISGWEQFENVAYHVDQHGTPILEDTLLIFFCSMYRVYEAGDHSIILGQVEEIELVREGGPLLYYDRSYRPVGDELNSTLFVPIKRVSSDTP